MDLTRFVIVFRRQCHLPVWKGILLTAECFVCSCFFILFDFFLKKSAEISYLAGHKQGASRAGWVSDNCRGNERKMLQFIWGTFSNQEGSGWCEGCREKDGLQSRGGGGAKASCLVSEHTCERDWGKKMEEINDGIRTLQYVVGVTVVMSRFVFPGGAVVCHTSVCVHNLFQIK